MLILLCQLAVNGVVYFEFLRKVEKRFESLKLVLIVENGINYLFFLSFELIDLRHIAFFDESIDPLLLFVK